MTNKYVLIVTQDGESIDTVSNLLTFLDYKVESARTVGQTIRGLNQKPYAIILDVQVKHIDVREILFDIHRDLKESPSNNPHPLIFYLIDKNGPSFSPDIFKFNYDNTIEKPFSSSELLIAISEYFPSENYVDELQEDEKIIKQNCKFIDQTQAWLDNIKKT